MIGRALLTLAFVVLAGCSSVPSDTLVIAKASSFPHEPFHLAKGEAWFSTGELVERSRSYIKDAHLAFDLRGSDVAVYVNADRGPAFVRVVFLHGIGGDVCSVWIDRKGTAIRHALGKAVD